MPFPDSFIEELIARNDIVDVVGGYVRLTKRGGSWFGLCPFHNERTPSFSVNPSGQYFHCFGCGKGGGVINFVMEIEGLPYADAVANLAKRAGMQLPEQSEDQDSRRRARLLRLNKDAARFFYDQLSTPAGERAAAYMRERRISPGIARRFGLGYAPDSWDSLRNAMQRAGYSEQELFDAGLVKKGKNGGFYDAFRNRLVFPVIDVRGEVIAFSGRILGDGEPKYLNSPDTPVYSKSRNLFALNLAKKSKAGYLILTEGNIDVVALHQAGFDSAVASLGTSLTAEQARLLSRYSSQVIICYDNDGAGIHAAQRAIGILERLDLKVKVLRLQGAKDPDEYIKSRGADAFRNLLEASEDQLEYRLNSVLTKYDLSQDEQKVTFLREATELLSTLPGVVERQVYAARVATLAGVGQDAVTAEVERLRKRKLGKARREAERKDNRPERLAQPEARALRYSDPSSAAAEEGLIRLLCLDPELGKKKELPAPEEFSSEALEKIYRLLLEKIAAGAEVGVSAFAGGLSREEMDLLVTLLQKPERLSESERALRDYIRVIRRRREEQETTDLNALAQSRRAETGFRQS